MICSTDIVNLKSDILDKIGQKIIVKGSLGRNKYNEGARNATYSYTDILTRTVEVQVLNDDNTYCPLIPPIEQVNKKRIKV